MSSPDNFFIKTGYQCNENSSTYNYDESVDYYWTEERIHKADKFQHHVYLLAAKIIKKKSSNALLMLAPALERKQKIYFHQT